MTSALTTSTVHNAMSTVNSYGYYSDYGCVDYWNSYPSSVSSHSHSESPDPFVNHHNASNTAYFGTVSQATTSTYPVDGYPNTLAYTPSLPLLPQENTDDPSKGIIGPKRRVTAGRKERRRTQSINNAFSELRDCIPNVPSDTKLSKIKTLRLATSYIAYLMELLASDNNLEILTNLPGHGFKAELGKRTRTPEQEERRKRELAIAMMQSPGRGNSRKGRTGWPQHVWALELENPSQTTISSSTVNQSTPAHPV